MIDPAGRHAWLWLLPAFGLCYFWNLGASEFTPIDESRSVVIVRDMTESGNWLLPRTPDGYLSEKPPLYYGLSGVASSLLGRNEWTIRGVSVLMALATLLVVGWTAQLFGTCRTSVIAVGVLGSNILFTAWARTAMVDMTFTFFVSVGMAAYFAARKGRLGLWAAAALCGLSFGLAVLCKGPLGLALPVAGVVGDLLISSRGRFWKAPFPWAAVGASLLITIEVSLLWYLPAALAGGREFLQTSVLDENFYMPLGLSRGIAGSHAKPLWYYPTRQLMVFLPTAAFLPETFRWLFQKRADPDRTLLATWTAAGLLILMVASNKRAYYLLPLQPAIALMIAAAVSPLWDADPAKWLRWGARLAGGLVVIFALTGAAINVARIDIPGFEEGHRLADLLEDRHGWVAVACGIAGASGILMLLASRGRSSAMIQAAILSGLLIAGLRSFVLDPIRGSEDRMRPFVSDMIRHVPPGARVAIWPPIYGYALDGYWPTRLKRDVVTAAAADLFFVRENSIPELPFAVETLGTLGYSTEIRRVALVRRTKNPGASR